MDHDLFLDSGRTEHLHSLSVWYFRTRPPGVTIWPHWSVLTTRSPPQSRTCPHSTVLIGISSRSSRKTMETRDFHWLYSMVRCCHQTSSRPWRVFLLGLVQMKVAPNWHRHSLTCYTRVWLSTIDLPLHVHSQKLAPRFVDPLPIAKIINPASVKRLRCLKVPPNFTLLDSTLLRTAHWFHHSSWFLHPGWSQLAKHTRSKDCWQQWTEAAVGNTWLNGRSWMGGHEKRTRREVDFSEMYF